MQGGDKDGDQGDRLGQPVKLCISIRMARRRMFKFGSKGDVSHISARRFLSDVPIETSHIYLGEKIMWESPP